MICAELTNPNKRQYDVVWYSENLKNYVLINTFYAKGRLWGIAIPASKYRVINWFIKLYIIIRY